MGGCRCFFRDCKVNSYKIPSMHFFHYPLKDSKRYEEWRKYTKQEMMTGYPLAKQKNIIICSRHFRDECFMNYKMERLTATAVPTIHRLSKDKALDFELDIENGVLVTLPPITQEHLIPPNNFKYSLELENDLSLMEKLRQLETQDQGETIDTQNDAIDESEESVPAPIAETIEMEIPKCSLKVTYSEKRRKDHQPIYSANKRQKLVNSSEQLMLSKEEIIVLPQGTSIAMDNVDNSNPTIINHQILETEGNMWVEQESYNIDDDGADYEIVEIQSNITQDNVPVNNEESFVTPQAVSDEQEVYTSKEWETTCAALDKANSLWMEENKILEEKLHACQTENIRSEKHMAMLKTEVINLKNEAEELNLQLQISQTCGQNENELREKYEQQLQIEQTKHAEIEEKLMQQITILEHSLVLVRQQLTETKNSISLAKKDYANVQNEKLNVVKQQVETEHKLHQVQELCDNTEIKHSALQKNYEILQKTHTKLKEDYKKLESQHNQVTTTSTTNSSSSGSQSKSDGCNTIPPPSTSGAVGTLSKAQLYNGIKRYIGSSMQALLRMEMFGSSEREWKPDERQVSVDLLRLGESVYKYFTDEWRFRLPGLRDARNWLTQAVNLDDEEDL